MSKEKWQTGREYLQHMQQSLTISNNKGHVIFLIYKELLQTDRKKDNGKMGKGYKQGIYRGLSTNS